MSNGIRASVALESQIRAEKGTQLLRGLGFERRCGGRGRIAGTELEAVGEGGLFSSGTGRRDVGVAGKMGWGG